MRLDTRLTVDEDTTTSSFRKSFRLLRCSRSGRTGFRPSFLFMSRSFTKQELAQLGLLKCWKAATVRKYDVYLLPKQLDEKVATSERRAHSQQNLQHG